MIELPSGGAYEVPICYPSIKLSFPTKHMALEAAWYTHLVLLGWTGAVTTQTTQKNPSTTVQRISDNSSRLRQSIHPSITTLWPTHGVCCLHCTVVLPEYT